MDTDGLNSSRGLIKRFESLKSARSQVEQQWEAIGTYVAPYTGRFFRDNSGENSVEWKQSRKVFDSTPVQSHIQLASSLHGALTNPAVQWFDLIWRDTDLSRNHAARVWLEKAAKRVFVELQESNFNLEANMVYRNLTSYASAAIIEEPVSDMTDQWRGVTFTSVPLKEVYFEPDDRGQCLTFFRHMQWPPSRIVAKFGIDNCSEKVRQAYSASQDAPQDIVFAVFTRDLSSAQMPSERLLPPANRPYGWAYIDRNQPDFVYAEGGYYEMPAFIARWDVVDESMWGYGPAHYALADIMTLNALVEIDLRSREKVLDPALLVEERAVLNTLDLGPGAQNVVRNIDRIRPLESTARFDVAESAIVRLRSDIQSCFFIDKLELKESPAMTATEVQVRYELMQRLLSSTMSRIREDFLNPLIQRTFNLLLRSGELEAPPQGVSTDYDVVYIGPLSRAMKFDTSASIERYITQLQLIAQSGAGAEQVLLVPDYDAIARFAADQLNLPTDLIRSKEDVEDDLAAMREQSMRQASASAAQAETQAAKNLGQARQLAQGDQSIATGTGESV